MEDYIKKSKIIKKNNQNQENIATDDKNILNDVVVMQQESVETLKKYL